MKTSKKATINGHTVEGQAHIQPGVNHWIGVLYATEAIFKHIPENWEAAAATIEYEGPFQCGKNCVHGKGQAQIIYIDVDKKKGRVTVNLQGVEEATLDKNVEQNLRYSYNKNLSFFEKHKSH